MAHLRLLTGAANCLTQSRPQKAANYRVLGYNLPMTTDDEKRIAAMMAKTLETICVINTVLDVLRYNLAARWYL
jgi:hypothetical protein